MSICLNTDGNYTSAKANLAIASAIMMVAGQKNDYSVRLLKGVGI